MDKELFLTLLIIFIFGCIAGWFFTMIGYESCQANTYHIPYTQARGQYIQLPNGTLWKKQ